MLSNKLTIKVDGGASISNIFRQFQADILGVPVIALLGESAGEDTVPVLFILHIYNDFQSYVWTLKQTQRLDVEFIN